MVAPTGKLILKILVLITALLVVKGVMNVNAYTKKKHAIYDKTYEGENFCGFRGF